MLCKRAKAFLDKKYPNWKDCPHFSSNSDANNVVFNLISGLDHPEVNNMINLVKFTEHRSLELYTDGVFGNRFIIYTNYVEDKTYYDYKVIMLMD